MAKKRIIPKLQLMPSKLENGSMSLVTTVGFSKIIEIGSPISQAKIYEAQAADELIFIDLTASKGIGQKTLLTSLIKEAAEEIFLPLTIGGGVSNIEDFRLLLKNGADKVCINTAALQNPDLITQASKIFGAQCVVVSIDYKLNDDGIPYVYSQSGTVRHNYHPLDWALMAEKKGAGEILLTSIDHDGKRNGLELEVSRQISEKLSIPIILSGGCGQAKHFIDGFKKAKADAVSAGTFFCFQDQGPMQTRSHIKNAGINIRTHT